MAMSNGPHLNGNAVSFRTKKWTGGNPTRVFKIKTIDFFSKFLDRALL